MSLFRLSLAAHLDNMKVALNIAVFFFSDFFVAVFSGKGGVGDPDFGGC